MKVLKKNWKEGDNLGIGKSNSDFSHIIWPDSSENLKDENNVIVFDKLTKEDQIVAFEKHFNVLKNVYYNIWKIFHDIDTIPPFLKQFILIENCIYTTKETEINRMLFLEHVEKTDGFDTKTISLEHPVNDVEFHKLIYDISFYDNVLASCLPSFLYNDKPHTAYYRRFDSIKEIEIYIYNIIKPQKSLLLEINGSYKNLVIVSSDFKNDMGYLLRHKII